MLVIVEAKEIETRCLHFHTFSSGDVACMSDVSPMNHDGKDLNTIISVAASAEESHVFFSMHVCTWDFWLNAVAGFAISTCGDGLTLSHRITGTV